MQKITHILLIGLLLTTLLCSVGITTASAQGPEEGNLLGAPPIPEDVLAITGDAPFVKLLSAEAYARGGLAVVLLEQLARERDAIADQMLFYGIEVTPRGKYQQMEPPASPETTDPGTIDELDKARFEAYLNSMLGTITEPETPDEAKALEAKIIGEVENWLSQYRAEVSAKLAAAPQPLVKLATVNSTDGSAPYDVYAYRNAYKIQVTLELPDFSDQAERLQTILDSIGSASTVDQAWQAVNLYYTESNKIQSEAHAIAAEIQANVTAAFNEWARQFQEYFTADLQAHGAALGEAATLALLEQAKDEAIAAKNEIFARLVAEIQASMPKIKNPTPEQIAALMKQGFEIGMSRGAAEGLQVQQEMQARYLQLAEEEKARITDEMNRQAAEAEQWARKELNRIGNSYRNIWLRSLETVNSEFSDDFEQWQLEALKARRDIYATVLDYRLQEAYQAVEANRDLLDKGYAAGYLKFDADGLLEMINDDRETQLNAFMAAGDNAAAIAQVEATFTEHWNELALTLERAKLEAAGAAIAILEEQIKWDEIRRAPELVTMLKNNWENSYDLYLIVNDRYASRGSSAFKSQISYCIWTKGSDYFFERYPELMAMIDELDAQGEVINNLVNRWDNMRTSPDNYTVDQVLAFRDEFVVAWRDNYAPKWSQLTDEMGRYFTTQRLITNDCIAQFAQ